MISAGDFRKGVTFEINGEPYVVVDFQHVKPGKGAAFVRTKYKSLKAGATREQAFNPSEKFPKAHIETKEVQYLYNDGDLYYFMDNESYEQIMLTSAQIGKGTNYLKEGLLLEILTTKGDIVAIELPNSVELQVMETEPGLKGDRATAGTKAAKLETGVTIQV